MAVLKKIKFGAQGNATPIAQTVVTAASESVLSVVGTNTGIDDNADPSYAVDLNISSDGTLVKDTTNSQAVLKVGTVPAAQVRVAAGGHNASADPADDKTFVGDDVEEVLLELNNKIADVGGEAKSYKIVEVTNPAGTSLAEYKIQEQVGTGSWGDVTGSTTIVVPKDNAFVTAQLGHVGATAGSDGTITDGSGEDALLIEYINGSGVYTLVAVPIGAFLKEAEFKDGLAVNASGEVSAKLGQGLEFGSESGENKSIKVKIDSTSSDAENFLSVGANGVKISGVQDAIDTSIQALDNTSDAAVAGQYITYITEADGIVSAGGRADISGAPLNNYAKGSEATAVAATDTINQAISKLENQIDAVADAAEDAHSVVEHASGNTHVTVAGATNANGGMTYTVSETNIADADDLADEITRAKQAEAAIDTAVGLTKAADPSETRSITGTTNYGGSATTVMGNMQALDTQLKSVSDSLAAIQYSVSGTELTFYGMTQHA